MKKIIVYALAAVASAGWADTGAWKVPSWSPVLSAPDAVKKVIDGKCPGHSQGMCVTSNAFYLSFHNQIVKTDWKGRFLKRVEVVPQVLVRYGELKDGKIVDITKYIGFPPTRWPPTTSTSAPASRATRRRSSSASAACIPRITRPGRSRIVVSR